MISIPIWLFVILLIPIAAIVLMLLFAIVRAIIVSCSSKKGL